MINKVIKMGGSNLKIIAVTQRDSELIKQLTEVWESSVRATHKFLNEEDIQSFKESLPTVLTKITHLIIAIDDQSRPIAFMGINEPEIDMLFIDDKDRGQGIGKALIHFGITNYQANQITVNEQNPQAKGFYEHMGFAAYQRLATDDQGKPFPILRMKLKNRTIILLKCRWLFYFHIVVFKYYHYQFFISESNYQISLSSRRLAVM